MSTSRWQVLGGLQRQASEKKFGVWGESWVGFDFGKFEG